MTRPARSSLVLDGDTLRVRLEADRVAGPQVVHVDWLRFTLQLRNAPYDLDLMFPEKTEGNYWDVKDSIRERHLAALELEESWSPGGQALAVARKVARYLGPDFSVAGEPQKGHDFYARRWPIVWNDAECGWVGFGASSDSPRQQKQAATIHVNLYGMACTFAERGWRKRMARFIKARKATVTRIDLALDFFDGFPGGLDGIIDGYKAGDWDVRGQRPKCNGAGDWVNKRARSFYVGSREAGKQTNVYEKGHQMYGPESGMPWLRWELRLGNKLRELDADILANPDGFFAGAGDAHAAALALAREFVQPVEVPTRPRIQDETVEAEVERSLRWLRTTAAPSIALAFKHLGDEGFLELVQGKSLPRRLQKYSSRIGDAVSAVADRVFGLACGAAPFTAVSSA